MSNPTPKQMSEFFQQVNTGHITSEILQLLLENPNVVFPQNILERLIHEAELDGRLAINITSKNFLVKREPDPNEELIVVHPNEGGITTDMVITHLAEQGLVPAEIEYFLLYKKNNPNEKRNYKIVGLGSVWWNKRGSGYCPYLPVSSYKYGVDLGWVGSRGYSSSCRLDVTNLRSIKQWNNSDRFLARRKPIC